MKKPAGADQGGFWQWLQGAQSALEVTVVLDSAAMALIQTTPHTRDPGAGPNSSSASGHMWGSVRPLGSRGYPRPALLMVDGRRTRELKHVTSKAVSQNPYTLTSSQRPVAKLSSVACSMSVVRK